MTRLDSLFISVHRLGFALVHRVVRLLVLLAGGRSESAEQLRRISRAEDARCQHGRAGRDVPSPRGRQLVVT